MKNQTSVAGSPQKGFGLLETLLALGAVSVLSLGIYMVLKPASATAQISVESDNLTQLASSIDRSFGLVGGFDGVSASRVVIDGLAPDKMTKGTALRTQWGAPVSVASTSIKAPNDGFTVTYPNTPADVCSSLAAAVYRQTYDIRIGGTSVVSDGSFNPAATASACNGNGVTMEFVYHSGLVAGTAVAAPPLVLPDTPVAVLPPDSAPIGDAVDPVDGVGGAAPLNPVESNPVAAPPPVPPALPPEVAPVSPTTPPVTPVAPPVTPPTASVAACSVPANTVENQNVYCPAGQYGLINQSRFATWSCPEAWDAPVQGPFSAWTNAGGSCATCPGGSEQTQSQWVVASAPCPSGQVGSNTWEKEQRQTRSVTYSCPAGTTSLPSPNIGGWSAWVDTGATRNASNTCTTPAPVGEVCWGERESGTVDARDAYYSVSYSINGTVYDCSVSRVHDGPQGFSKCNALLARDQWEAVAKLGDTYSISGSDTGWESGAGEFWTWERQTWEKKASCSGGMSTGNFEVVEESCASETHYNLPSLSAQAASVCNGRPVGWEGGTIHHFPDYQIGCYATITCK